MLIKIEDGKRPVPVDTMVEVEMKPSHAPLLLVPRRADSVAWLHVARYKVSTLGKVTALSPGWHRHDAGGKCPDRFGGGARIGYIDINGKSGCEYAGKIDWPIVDTYCHLPDTAPPPPDVLNNENTELRDKLVNVTAERDTLRAENYTLRDERETLERDIAATCAGYNSAMQLQQVFTAQAETREARALHNYASSKLERAVLAEQIAMAISRGHLQADFYAKLREWSK